MLSRLADVNPSFNHSEFITIVHIVYQIEMMQHKVNTAL